MLTLALLVFAVTSARARNFNITDLIIPPIVQTYQDEVEIECRYDANFTLLNWFKGPNEFFRYRPGAAPSTKSFPVLGIGRIELITCGPTECRLRLGGITEEATGLYRCDIERDLPPYKFESRQAHMQVHGHEHRRPLLEGLAEEYGEGDEIKAFCRGEEGSEKRWYINGREVNASRGSFQLVTNSSRLMFEGVAPTITVQCAEFRFGELLGSKERKARWRNVVQREDKDKPLEQIRNSVSKLEHMLVAVLWLWSAKLL